ncbi:MAG: hypothetical protein IPO88_17415 [Nannocystis sp.]|uniref:hypothetical protein n=1 Tax=Nannocystis sp. TaxID=1962667 RepID=UPI002426E6B2|nr:hypothetical protein [Nannocystis sp.]MBK9755244.1 hypothetical protein [Nannocystis sp.]
MKWLKRIAVLLVLLLLIAGGVIFYLWRQVTALPEWYTAEQAGQAEPAAAAEATATATPDGPLVWKDAPGAAPGKHKELRNFHRRAAKKDPVVAKVIKASRASFNDGTLEMGVVADLRNLPHDSLRPADRELFEKLHNAFPSATDREIYIGVIDSSPVLQGGEIELGPQAELVIGNLQYGIDAAAGRMGMAPAALRKQWSSMAKNLGITAPSP